MAEGGFFSRLFKGESKKEEVANSSVFSIETDSNEHKNPTIQDAINFVYELQSYYHNDICKAQADLILLTEETSSKVNFMTKKSKQEQQALAQIDEVIVQVRKIEQKFNTVRRKSGYSFYSEIESEKLKKAQLDIFYVLIQLCQINTKPELESVIVNRLESYRSSWNIDANIIFPKNYNAILVDGNNDIEEYRFGDFSKKIKAEPIDKKEYTLSLKQLNQIRNLNLEFDKEFSIDEIWVRVATAKRFQLNNMSKTCILDNSWEYIEEPKKLLFDVVKVKEFEQYLKGLLPLILSKETYVVISILVPSNYVRNLIGPIKVYDQQISIEKWINFFMKERSRFGDELLTARIDRRFIRKDLHFLPYEKFRKLYF